jgi:DNA replication protein DnaC
MEAITELLARIGSIQKIGERTCDDCGSIVPIYVRIDREGLKHQHSVCMFCENKKLTATLPKQEDVRNGTIKLRKWIEFHQTIESSIQNATFSNYYPITPEQHEAKRLAMGYAKKFGEFTNHHSILFKGDVGLGKSHLSNAIAKEVSQKGYTVLFITAPALMNAIKATYISDACETQEQFMQMLDKLDLLILDDIGAEYVKIDPNGFESWAADILFQITNIRQNKPTIYTTNYTSSEMEEKYGRQSKRILSRMLSGAYVVTLEGKDHRVEVN